MLQNEFTSIKQDEKFRIQREYAKGKVDVQSSDNKEARNDDDLESFRTNKNVGGLVFMEDLTS